MKKSIMNQINAVGLELQLNELTNDINKTLQKDELYITYIEMKYRDKLRDMELINDLQEKMLELIKLVNKLNDIEMKAIAYEDNSIIMKCEARKTKVINMMELIRVNYM